jgi:hypothetical protein
MPDTDVTAAHDGGAYPAASNWAVIGAAWDTAKVLYVDSLADVPSIVAAVVKIN